MRILKERFDAVIGEALEADKTSRLDILVKLNYPLERFIGEIEEIKQNIEKSKYEYIIMMVTCSAELSEKERSIVKEWANKEETTDYLLMRA